MSEQCNVCEYKKDDGPKRLRELELEMITQKQETHTTNLILGRIETALITYMEESKQEIKANRDDISEIQPIAAVLRDRSNTQKELNYKALGWLVAIIGVFGTIITSIIF